VTTVNGADVDVAVTAPERPAIEKAGLSGDHWRGVQLAAPETEKVPSGQGRQADSAVAATVVE